MYLSKMNTNKMENVKEQICRVFHKFKGDFIVPKNAYEQNLCNILGWQTFDGRYYDAFNGETFIEIKKGQGGMHFDMVRYAEIVMGFGPQDTVTVFFKWNKSLKQIISAYIIDTKDLIQFLKIDREYAKMYLRIYRHVPRGVNILASATANDLRNIATYVIDNNDEYRNKLVVRYVKTQTFDQNKWPDVPFINHLIVKMKRTMTSDPNYWPDLGYIYNE